MKKIVKNFLVTIVIMCFISQISVADDNSSEIKAIEDLKLAMEGMLSPDVEEKIICNIEVREIFKISKIGTIAGCMVQDGKLTRKSKVRLIRDGVVVYTGKLSSLKRFKEDVNEVKKGFECGMSIENFNDIKVGDIIEGYDNVEVKRELS